MTNTLVEDGFKAVVQTGLENLPAFVPPEGKVYHWYTSGERGDFKLPCTSFEMKESAPLHGMTLVSQGVLTIWIETQADDEDEATHVARCTAVRAFLADTEVVAQAITALGNVHLFGFAVVGAGGEVKGRRSTTGFDLNVGFGPAAPLP